MLYRINGIIITGLFAPVTRSATQRCPSEVLFSYRGVTHLANFRKIVCSSLLLGALNGLVSWEIRALCLVIVLFLLCFHSSLFNAFFKSCWVIAKLILKHLF